VDFHHFRLFRDLAHERSISKGAENNGISQSAASQHLQELERMLGVILVAAHRRWLTEAGRIYRFLPGRPATQGRIRRASAPEGESRRQVRENSSIPSAF
jgi:DNA-binding transcriptional ArsR family regulator